MYDACVCILYRDILLEKWHCLTEYLFESISLRDCTAKGEGFVVMWQCLSGMQVKLGYHMRPAPRERSFDKTQPVFVSSVPLSQLWTESFDPGT